ncbi:hypothetical protein BJV78DRAFT_1251705 [Lactifluus subvellereus]|nr:hypothetical protein BJV78DRAFT_1251705 [Lactifluus subvellereus]
MRGPPDCSTILCHSTTGCSGASVGDAEHKKYGHTTATARDHSGSFSLCCVRCHRVLTLHLGQD